MGLAIVNKIINDHDGNIVLLPNQNGAKITINLQPLNEIQNEEGVIISEIDPNLPFELRKKIPSLNSD